MIEYFDDIEVIQKLTALRQEFSDNVGILKNYLKITKESSDDEKKNSFKLAMLLFRKGALEHLQITNYTSFPRSTNSVLFKILFQYRMLELANSPISIITSVDTLYKEVNETIKILNQGTKTIEKRILELEQK